MKEEQLKRVIEELVRHQTYRRNEALQRDSALALIEVFKQAGVTTPSTDNTERLYDWLHFMGFTWDSHNEHWFFRPMSVDDVR